MIAANTIIHNVSDTRMMGKIFSSLEVIIHLGFLLFMFIGSKLGERIPHGLIVISIGAVISITGIINLLCHKKIPWLAGDNTHAHTQRT
jgi:hypothetical protein